VYSAALSMALSYEITRINAGHAFNVANVLEQHNGHPNGQVLGG